MIIKYYSEVLDKFFNTVPELQEAELQHKKDMEEKEKKKALEKEELEALKKTEEKVLETVKDYLTALRAFNEKYGYLPTLAHKNWLRFYAAFC